MTLGRWALEYATRGPRADIAHAQSIARSARFGATSVLAASRFAENRHRAGEPLAVIGSEWFHSGADRIRAITQLATDFEVFQNDLGAGMAARMANRTPEERVLDEAWLRADVVPTLAEWSAFAAKENASWLVRFTTGWDAYQEWQDRLKRLRELARAHGVHLASAEPVALPKTIWERGSAGAGSTADTWLGVLKVVVLAAIGVTGFATLFAVVRDLRGTKST